MNLFPGILWDKHEQPQNLVDKEYKRKRSFFSRRKPACVPGKHAVVWWIRSTHESSRKDTGWPPFKNLSMCLGDTGEIVEQHVP